MTATHTLLCVDDEPAILSALRRLFRESDYEILTAENGEAGIQVLADRDVDLIIADQRMPGMIGAQMLAQARQLRPNAMRIILTGHADLEAATQAINEGGVHRYITKPWDDDELRQVVREALERHDLLRENKRLGEALQARNRELEALNQSLESRVMERTREVREGLERNIALNERLQRKVRELEARDRIAHHLLTVHSLEETLELLVQTLTSALELERVAVHVVDVDGSPRQALAGPGEMAAAGQPALQEARQSGSPSRWSAGGLAGLVVPILKGEEVLGVLAAEAGAELLNEETEAALMSFGVQAAIAIGDARLQGDMGTWRQQLNQVMEEISEAGDGES